jgi:pimeloyl-ACP methyl ester carboxylesterase
VPYLARQFKVITIDPRGNGRSDRPTSAAAYAETELAADTVAVMDACDVDRAVIVGISSGSWYSLLTAALYPDRVLGVVAIASWAPELLPWPAHRAVHDFDEILDTEEGWARENRNYWLRDWRGMPSSSSASCLASRTRPSSARTASAGRWRQVPRRC